MCTCVSATLSAGEGAGSLEEAEESCRRLVRLPGQQQCRLLARAVSPAGPPDGACALMKGVLLLNWAGSGDREACMKGDSSFYFAHGDFQTKIW